MGNAESPLRRPRGQVLQPYELGHAEQPFTQREHAIAQLLADGFTMVEIARELGLSPWTVRHHAKNMRVRSDTHTAHGLVAWALRRGLIR
jgi:DNA-binding CsgD family transcriptional regulator